MNPQDKPRVEPVEPVDPQEQADHRDKTPEHPQRDRVTRHPSAEQDRAGSEGSLGNGSNEDEDARSKRRDLGP